MEATKFLLGTGTNEPGGVLNIGGTDGLTTTQRVQTQTSATYAFGDPWLLKAQLPPRFIPAVTYAAGPAIWDKTYRFVAQGSTTEPRQFSDGDRGGNFLGAPKEELSTFVTTTTTGSKIMVAGDWNTGYAIIDRVGRSLLLLPCGWRRRRTKRLPLPRGAVMAASKTLVAVTSFACTVKGVEHIIRQGDTVPSNHPAVKGREQLFEPATEQAA